MSSEAPIPIPSKQCITAQINRLKGKLSRALALGHEDTADEHYAAIKSLRRRLAGESKPKQQRRRRALIGLNSE